MLDSLRNQGARRAGPLALLIATLCGATAQAGSNDGLRVEAGLGIVHDDNLFRLADAQSAFDGRRGDNARQAFVGLSADYGEYATHGQHIAVHARLTRVNYEHFSALDYDAQDAGFNWQGRFGARLSGAAGASYLQSLASYTDLRATERRLRVQRRVFGDAAWRWHPAWQVRAGAAREQFAYEQPIERVNNRSETTLETGADYLPASGSSVGLGARRIVGRYAKLRPVGAGLEDDSFTEDALLARVSWQASAIGNVQLLAGHTRRRHAHGGGRDAAGLTGRAGAAIDRGGKLRWKAAAWREFAAVESTLIGYSLNRGMSVGASYAPSAKVWLDAAASHERRSAEARVGTAPAGWRDTLDQASLGATWSLHRRMALVLTAVRQQRGGAASAGNGSYRAHTVSLNVNMQF